MLYPYVVRFVERSVRTRSATRFPPPLTGGGITLSPDPRGCNSALFQPHAMIKRRLKRLFPSHDTFRSSRWLRWLDPWLGHPKLWHMHRRAVATGIAIGIVTGLIPGPVQMLLAALIAIPLRANVPAAAFATLYTNPITFVPLYLLAYKIGAWLTGAQVDPGLIKPFTASAWDRLLPELWQWLSNLGEPLLIGLAVQASCLAALAYVLTLVTWRIAVSWAWQHRRRKRPYAS
jgi:uncharacterized protein